MGKARVNKFLHLHGWKLGHVLTDAREKSLGNWITHFDIGISQIIEDLLLELKFPHVFISEETWNESQNFKTDSPVIILDPIDGTRGFKEGTQYFCLSLLAMEEGRGVFSWLWNFGTQEEVVTFTPSFEQHVQKQSLEVLHGLVSDSEWQNQLWNSAMESTDIKLVACGSIAYKLLLLAEGKCDFVASKRPKNLWDIAGGTHALSAKGFKLYCQNSEVLSLDRMLWPAPLLWCRPEYREKLNDLLFGINL